MPSENVNCTDIESLVKEYYTVAVLLLVTEWIVLVAIKYSGYVFLS